MQKLNRQFTATDSESNLPPTLSSLPLLPLPTFLSLLRCKCKLVESANKFNEQIYTRAAATSSDLQCLILYPSLCLCLCCFLLLLLLAIQAEAWAKSEASPASCKFCVCASGPQGNEAVILSESLSLPVSVFLSVCV